MDWHLAIERNAQALKRILAAIIAMAGLRAGSLPRSGGDAAQPIHLPRRLHRAVLRLLRPAESAVRRLVIVAARGITVALPPRRAAKPTRPLAFVRNGKGTGIVLPPAAREAARQAAPRKPVQRLSLPLFDRLPPGRQPIRARSASSGAPRISGFGGSMPFAQMAPRFAIPPAPAPDDPIPAARLALRLQALASALDDLPGQARRFARWRAARVRDRDLPRSRVRRVSALRGGRPPGSLRRPTHEVHDVLAELNGLAVWALERANTS